MLLFAPAVSVDCRIAGVEVFGIQMILDDAEGFAEALEMHDFPCAQEADGICHIRILYDAQNVVVGASGFLLCCNFARTTFF